MKAEALRIGLTEDDFNDAISNDEYAYKVKQDIQEAYELGVTGVPFFVFDRKYAVSGAQPSDAFLNTLKASYDDWKAKQKQHRLLTFRSKVLHAILTEIVIK